MTAKTILIAHHLPAVRDRFAVALADARHEFVIADNERDVRLAVSTKTIPLSLAILDLALAEDGIDLVRAVRQVEGDTPPLPVIVFSGSLRSAADVPALQSLGVGYINEYASTAQILPGLAPHLFPDNFNRRTSPRVAIGLPISYRAGGTIAPAVTIDVGKGGLAVRTMTPLPKDTATQVKIKLPGLGAEIEIGARVAWSRRAVGMGVQFEELSQSDQRVVDDFIDKTHRSH